eukprot:2759484-Alexandrium_andersonii.AAC.1
MHTAAPVSFDAAGNRSRAISVAFWHFRAFVLSDALGQSRAWPETARQIRRHRLRVPGQVARSTPAVLLCALESRDRDC